LEINFLFGIVQLYALSNKGNLDILGKVRKNHGR